jgi:hypothetical protein
MAKLAEDRVAGEFDPAGRLKCLRIIARISGECWLQGNTWTKRESDECKEKATPEFLARQLRDAGFLDVTVITPKRYHRPLLIGRKPLRMLAGRDLRTPEESAAGKCSSGECHDRQNPRDRRATISWGAVDSRP